MRYPQARQPFWLRHPWVAAAALLCGHWLLQHGFYVSVAILAAALLLVSVRRRRRDKAQRNAGLRARAEIENRLVLAGDPRGVHGRYPPVWSGHTALRDRGYTLGL